MSTPRRLRRVLRAQLGFCSTDSPQATGADGASPGEFANPTDKALFRDVSFASVSSAMSAATRTRQQLHRARRRTKDGSHGGGVGGSRSHACLPPVGNRTPHSDGRFEDMLRAARVRDAPVAERLQALDALFDDIYMTPGGHAVMLKGRPSWSLVVEADELALLITGGVRGGARQ